MTKQPESNSSTSDRTESWWRKTKSVMFGWIIRDTTEISIEQANFFSEKAAVAGTLPIFSKLVKQYPKEPRYLSNRCDYYMLMEQYDYALPDALRAIKLDSKYIRAYCQVIKCSITVGDLLTAGQYIFQLSRIDPKSKTLAAELKKLSELQNYIEREKSAAKYKKYNQALEYVNKSLTIVTHCVALKIRKAKYLALTGRCNEAGKINSEAKYILGVKLYYSDIEAAMGYFKGILDIDPNHSKALEMFKKTKKIIELEKKGNDAFNAENFATTHDIYLSALAIDPEHTEMKKKLYYYMGQASFNLDDFERAIDEFTESINIDANYARALKRRGMSYMKIKSYEEAIADLSRAHNLEPFPNYKKMIDEAEALMLCINDDPYYILGVNRDASVEEMKRAYRNKAMLHHPDRHSDGTRQQRERHERIFQKITLAYRDILSKVESEL